MRVCTGGIEHVIGWNEGDIEKYEGDHDKIVKEWMKNEALYKIIIFKIYK